MTWHIRYVCLLHWLWCLGSKLLSGGQSCWLWNMAGQRGVENWLKRPLTQGESAVVQEATCRWRSGPNHLLSPRTLHVCERDGENRHFYTSLPRSVCACIPPVLSSADVRVRGLLQEACLCLSSLYVERPCFQHVSGLCDIWHRPASEGSFRKDSITYEMSEN